MRLESVGCGAANERPDTVVALKMGNDRFNVYGSGQRVVVLSTDLVRLQELFMPSTVKAIDANSADGKIAVVHGNNVAVLKPTMVVGPRSGPSCTWMFQDELTCDGPVEAVSWDQTNTGRLLTGGTSIILWCNQALFEDASLQEEDEHVVSRHSLYVAAWRLVVASPVRLLRYSPDGRFFVSCGTADRLPKLWTRRDPDTIAYIPKTDQYDFVYLPHPRAVRSIEWRLPLTSDREFANALLTSCADNVARIWVESSGSFSVAGSIDADSLPAHDPEFTPFWLNARDLFTELSGYEPHNPDSSIHHAESARSSVPPPGPLLHRSASVDALFTQTKTLPTFLSARPTPITSPSRSPAPDHAKPAARMSSESKQAAATLSDHWPDVLMHVTAAGSLCLWRLPNLDDPQRRSFRVAKPQVVENAFPPGLHVQSVLVYADISSSYLRDGSRRDGLLPLAMVLRQRSGAMAKYRVSLAERSQLSRIVAVEYVGGCCGHTRPIAGLHAHPTHPVVVSIGAASDSAELVFWLLTPPTVFASNVPEGRSCEAFRVGLTSAPTAVCWLPAPGYLALLVCFERDATVYVCASWPVRHDQFSFTETGRVALKSSSVAALAGDHARSFRIVSVHGGAVSLATLTLSLSSHQPTLAWTKHGLAATLHPVSVVPLAPPMFAFPTAQDALLGLLGASHTLSLLLVSGTTAQPMDTVHFDAFPSAPRAIACYLGRIAVALEKTPPLSSSASVAAPWSSAPTSTTTAAAGTGTGETRRGEVVVYESSSTGVRHRVEDRISLPDAPHALAWLPDGVGGAMLAVGQARTILLYAQYTGNAHGRWMLLRRIALASTGAGAATVVGVSVGPGPDASAGTEPCMHMAAGGSGLLLVASATEVSLFSKWIAPEDWAAAARQVTQFTAPRPPTLFKQSSTTSLASSIPETPSPLAAGQPPAQPLVAMPSFSMSHMSSVISDLDAVNATLMQCHPRHLLHILMRGNRVRPRVILNHLLRVLSNPTLAPVPGTSRFPVAALPLATLARLEQQAVSASSRNDSYAGLFGSGGGGGGGGGGSGGGGGMFGLGGDADGFGGESARRTGGFGIGFGGGGGGGGGGGEQDGGGDEATDAESQKKRDEAKLLQKFDKAACEALAEQLTMRAIHGLTAVEQMSLAAIVEAFAAVDGDMHSGALDECGVRFYFAARRYSALARTSTALRKVGLRPSEYAWAFFSDAHERLLELCFANRATYDWAEFQALGAPYWVRSAETLRACCERIAKQRFSVNRQPLEAALFYIALKKKNILWGLFRSTSDERMSGFMSNDFTQERWQSAALKNAFALLSKQRFEEAAAFFLLANRLADAVQVCVSSLEDPHLAVFIARVYEGEGGPVLQRLLTETILPRAREQNDLYSICLVEWLLRNHQAAAEALLSSAVHGESARAESDAPAILSLYQFLRKHPQVCKVGALPVPLSLFRRTAYVFAQSGLPGLALETLKEMLAAEREQAGGSGSAGIGGGGAGGGGDSGGGGGGGGMHTAAKQKTTTNAMIQSGTFSFDDFDFGFGAPAPSTSSAAAAAGPTAAAGASSTVTAADLALTPRERQALQVGLQLDCSALALQLVLADLAGLHPSVADDDMRHLTSSFNSSDNGVLVADVKPHLLPAALLHERYPVAAAALALEDAAVRDAGFNRLVVLLATDVFTAVAAAGAERMPRTFPYPASVTAIDGHITSLLCDLSHCFQLACGLHVAFEPFVLAQLLLSFLAVRFEEAFSQHDTDRLLRAFSQLDDAGKFKSVLFGDFCFSFMDAAVAIAAGRAPGTSLVDYFDTMVDESLFNEVDSLATVDAVENGPEMRDGAPVPESLFTWTLLQLAVTHQMLLTIRHCVLCAQTAPDMLPSVSPALQAVVAMLSARVAVLTTALVPLPVPSSLSKSRASASHPVQQIFRVRGLLDVSSNPFNAVAPRRLWHWLLLREPLQSSVFEKAIYPPMSETVLTVDDMYTWVDTYRMHGDLMSMGLFAARSTRLVVAAAKGLFEFTLSTADGNGDSDRGDTRGQAAAAFGSGRHSPISLNSARRIRSIEEDTDPRAVMTMHRQVAGVRHVATHATMALYLTGGNDGAVKMFHFESWQGQDLRASGGARVTHIAFDLGGDKFGVTDVAGDLSLWRLGVQDTPPYFQVHCHAKRADTCAFLSTPSILATGGWNYDGDNVVLWDTLLSARQAAIHSFRCCDGGVRSMLYLPDAQRLVCGGKNGDIAVLDVRQRSVVQHWGASEGHMVRALAMHGSQLVTGCADGTVRLWSLTGQLIHNWPGVHARANMLTRSAVASLSVVGDTLYSCGADGLIRQCTL